MGNDSMQDPLPYRVMVSLSAFTALFATSNGLTLDCYGQNPPGDPQLMPLTYSVCKQAVLKIPTHGKALAPITFSHNPEAGFKVPHTWSHEGCVIIIDTLTADAEETATFAEIFMRAFELSAECVIKPPHLGGESSLGESDLLKIMMIESSIRMSCHPIAAKVLEGELLLMEVAAGNITESGIA